MQWALRPQQELGSLCQDVSLSGQVCRADGSPVIALDCGGLALSPTLLTHRPVIDCPNGPGQEALPRQSPALQQTLAGAGCVL